MSRILKNLTRRLLGAFGTRSPIVWTVPACSGRVALTFDDGPTPTTTKVLDILKEAQACATFFLLGQQVEKQPDLVRRILGEGHEVAIHGYDHGLTGFSRQVKRCSDDLAKIGVVSRWVRPPGGRIMLIPTLWLWWRGYRTILFNFDTHDSMRHEGKWTGASPDYGAARCGDIILMHDDNPVCLGELPVLLKVLKEEGLKAVSVSELMR
jgi:peptidoglycan/xylan/chitin deacetylase (PgdA/CDA1 family)